MLGIFQRDDAKRDGRSGEQQAIRSEQPTRHQLNLEGRIESLPGRFMVVLPVRAEHVTVEKRPVVFEEVVVRRQHVQDVERVTDTARREELRVDLEGDVRVTGDERRDWERR